MKHAHDAFQFVAASYLIRICPQRAWTLAELARELTAASDASIFYHTFQTQESHHYTSYSNDFAQWVDASCKVPVLGEALAAMDLRDYSTVDALRGFLVTSLEHYLAGNPHAADDPGYEPFYFCEIAEVVVPLERVAWNLPELADGIRKMSPHTLHHHFINSRLRAPLGINDFSHWVGAGLELPELAAEINRIDFYMNTVEGVRQAILRKIEQRIEP